jgi:hypothetical protein
MLRLGRGGAALALYQADIDRRRDGAQSTRVSFEDSQK